MPPKGITQDLLNISSLQTYSERNKNQWLFPKTFYFLWLEIMENVFWTKGVE